MNRRAAAAGGSTRAQGGSGDLAQLVELIWGQTAVPPETRLAKQTHPVFVNYSFGLAPVKSSGREADADCAPGVLANLGLGVAAETVCDCRGVAHLVYIYIRMRVVCQSGG